MENCFVGLGGNLDRTPIILQRCLERLRQSPEIKNFVISDLYQTTPVGIKDQPLFLNAVCRFNTSLSLLSLATHLQELEQEYGKKTLQKNGPRVIDLDLLFYGPHSFSQNGYTVPHPRWHERLFVLKPLSDVTDKVPIKDKFSLKQRLQNFTNPHQEIVQKVGSNV